MAFINNIFKNFLAVAAEIAEPSGVWEKIIIAFNAGIANYAWAIIIFTIVLKIALLPLDFFNKKITTKNTKVQAIIQPEIQKIQKQYGNNKQIVNQKTMEIYKKYNYNVTGSCVIMLVNMALTLFIFITLFSGLNSMASYKVGYQYQEMEKVYDQYVVTTGYNEYFEAYDAKYNEIYDNAYDDAYNEEVEAVVIAQGYADETELTDDEIEAVVELATAAANEAVEDESNIAEMVEAAEQAVGGKTLNEINSEINGQVSAKYSEIKNDWLWISNVWKSDTPWTKSLANFDEFNSMARITYKDSLGEGESETFYVRLQSKKQADKEKYENVMRAVENQNGPNGYLIIPILAVVTTALSSLATQGKLKFWKKKKENEPTASPVDAKKPGGLVLMILLPALMGYITLSFNAVFGLYILVSSLVGLATTPLINFGIRKLEERQEKKKAEKVEVSYKRK
jgi:YidC/Oxa1 family membrane protein insertase